MKHLVLDARVALPQTDGLGTYVRQIVPSICRQGAEQNRFRSTILAAPAVEGFWRKAVPEATILTPKIAPMRPPQNWQVPALLASIGADFYFYPAHDAPLFLRTPFAFTIHDVTLHRLRPYFERFDIPKEAYLRVLAKTALHRAAAVLAVSSTTRTQIGEVFGDRYLSKIQVTPNGVIPRAPARARERDRLLYVGTDRPHKNLHRIIRAYALARRSADLPPLDIIGGMRTPDELRKTIADEGVTDVVRLRGHVSNDELEEAYSRACMLVFPSLAEGFGLPILEAMVRSVPVLTSNVSACAEVAGDAALGVDPLDVRAIADGIVRLASDEALRAVLAERGRGRAREYAWSTTADKTFAVLAACVERLA